MSSRIKVTRALDHVRYEIRGPLFRRSAELEQAGHEIVKLNIGNPATFGFEVPEVLRRAMVEHLPQSDGYTHQKGILPAREAIAAHQRAQGAFGVDVDDIFLGNGVSELVLLALRALLDEGDEVLIPSPDYPLWTAATLLTGAKAVHYPCRAELGWKPDLEALRNLVTPRTRALVIISPNNPTGAVYPRETLEQMVALAEEYGLLVFSDEIYDGITYDGAEHVPLSTLVRKTLLGTFGGLSKVHRACGLRVGWLSFSGDKSSAAPYLHALDTLASLRLCSNVQGQWIIPTALTNSPSIKDLVGPGGRLYETRHALMQALSKSRFLSAQEPKGALYAFVKVDTKRLPRFDDQQFALDLLEQRHVLVTPGNGFNVPYRDHFRVTLLPDARTMTDVLARMESLLAEQAR